MLTLERFRALEAAVRAAGFDYSAAANPEQQPPLTPDDFASEAIYVICNSGMRVTIAAPIAAQCLAILRGGGSSADVFGHASKAAAIDRIWRDRAALCAAFLATADKVEFCATLPFIGPVTKYHLAKNLGVDTAKPDVHLVRLATREGVTPALLCDRLAQQTGYSVSTIDTILWRACAAGILKSKLYEDSGWDAAFAHGST